MYTRVCNILFPFGLMSSWLVCFAKYSHYQCVMSVQFTSVGNEPISSSSNWMTEEVVKASAAADQSRSEGDLSSPALKVSQVWVLLLRGKKNVSEKGRRGWVDTASDQVKRGTGRLGSMDERHRAVVVVILFLALVGENVGDMLA